MSKKEFVLGMESLLIPDATFQFGSDNIVTIPMATIDELEKYDGYPEERKNAKAVLKYLRELGIEKLVKQGVIQENGSLLKVALDPPQGAVLSLRKDLSSLSEYDLRRFKVCKYLQYIKTNDIDKVILISINDGTRMRAHLAGIAAEEPKFRLFPVLEEQYSGKIDIITSNDNLTALRQNGYIDANILPNLVREQLLPNMFVSLKNNIDGGFSTLGVYEDGLIKFLDLSTSNLPHGFKPIKKSQTFLLYALIQPPEKVPYVIVKGAAGTGKTFCSLIMGLSQTAGISWLEPTYRQVLVSAPMLDEKVKKIGAVKGNLEDKLNPYTAGILDNANEILNRHKYLKYKPKKEEANNQRKNKNSSFQSEEPSLPSDPLRNIMDAGLFRIVSLDLLRGRTLTQSFYIVDEAQNIRPEEMKTLLTRLGEGSKIVLLGDPSQTDAHGLNERYNGLTYASEKLKGKPFAWQIGFDEDESVRSPFVKEILKIF